MKQQKMEFEVQNMEKILHWQLRPNFKKLGLMTAIGAFGGMVLLQWVAPEMALWSGWLKYLLLAALLVMSISKETVEDEMIIQLRARSYQLAFICGVAYALLQPLVNLGVDSLISQELSSYSDLSITQVLFFMLAVQLGIFHLMKRFNG